jgi:arylsulfatase A-like enzyme
VIWFRTVRGLHRGFEHWELLPEDESPDGAAELITDFGIEFLAQNDGERSFLFLHYFDVHSPYHSRPSFERAFLPPGFRKRSKVDGTTLQLGLVNKGYGKFSAQEHKDVKKLYDAGILQLDHEIGRLFRFIEERFGFDDTLVIVTSDHGEGLFEHGVYSHGQSQYQEQLQVPLILRGGSAPVGARIEGPTSLIDIAPTIIAAAGASPMKPLPGVNLADYWQGPNPARDERVLYSQSAPGTGKDVIRMARRGRFKLITNAETGRRELYDLERDPKESTDLSRARPKLVDELSGLMQQFFAKPVRESASTLKLDTEVIERLQALGYVE